MKADNYSLIGRINQTLSDLEKVINRSEFLLEKFERTNDDGYLDGLALNLHSFYSGVERIFRDIASNIEKSLPSTSEWHQDLLLQMTSEIPNIRLKLLSDKSRNLLDEFRGFRHVIRNFYTFSINPSRVQVLTHSLQECYKSLCDDLIVFISFLEQV